MKPTAQRIILKLLSADDDHEAASSSIVLVSRCTPSL